MIFRLKFHGQHFSLFLYIDIYCLSNSQKLSKTITFRSSSSSVFKVITSITFNFFSLYRVRRQEKLLICTYLPVVIVVTSLIQTLYSLIMLHAYAYVAVCVCVWIHFSVGNREKMNLTENRCNVNGLCDIDSAAAIRHLYLELVGADKNSLLFPLVCMHLASITFSQLSFFHTPDLPLVALSTLLLFS